MKLSLLVFWRKSLKGSNKNNDLLQMKYLYLALIFAVAFLGCKSEGAFDAQNVIDLSIEAHGLNLLNKEPISFQFREHHYNIKRRPEGNRYTRLLKKDSVEIYDVMETDGSFQRMINGLAITIADSLAHKYGESINSVAYFFQLPLLLNDPAVIKELIGIEKINNIEYYKLKVSFKQQGGGTDFEDEFRYWIGKADHMMDYLAYSYQTNGGGIRFRQVVNRRNVNGLTVQDYINYKPEKKTTPLDQLPSLFEKGELIEVSRIEKKNVRLGPSEN